jgi:hypothetical protein
VGSNRCQRLNSLLQDAFRASRQIRLSRMATEPQRRRLRHRCPGITTREASPALRRSCSDRASAASFSRLAARSSSLAARSRIGRRLSPSCSAGFQSHGREHRWNGRRNLHEGFVASVGRTHDDLTFSPVTINKEKHVMFLSFLITPLSFPSKRS